MDESLYWLKHKYNLYKTKWRGRVSSYISFTINPKVANFWSRFSDFTRCWHNPSPSPSTKYKAWLSQGFLKGEKFCFRNLDFYFRHENSTTTASQLTSPASQKSKDLNKVSLLLQDLGWDT